MTRIRIVGLCLVASFALSAFVASAAQAGQVGECLKAAKVAKKYTGKYTDKNCTKAATKAEEEAGKNNKYEWHPGVTPAHAKFTATSGPAVLEGPAGNIACKASSTAGEWTSATTDTETATFTGCEFKGAVTGECHSAGQASGTIVTNKLDTKLIDHGEKGPAGGEPKEGEIWDSFVSTSGPTGNQAEYLCDSLIEIYTKGTLGGVFTSASVNVMSTKGEIEFNKSVGENSESGADLYNEVSIGGGPFEPGGGGVENLKAKIKNSGKIELKAI